MSGEYLLASPASNSPSIYQRSLDMVDKGLMQPP